MAKSNGRSRKMKRRTMRGGFLEWLTGKPATPVVTGTGAPDAPAVSAVSAAPVPAVADKSTESSVFDFLKPKPTATTAVGGKRRRHKKTAKK